ncbi:histone-lysine N-methyltransferase SETMAR [Trichonephila clavipes]|uniref:Histone-lysine N-methyltransferase SETMAR n=1 Tax=Trichonephila clavipes TaxID=2585209 RepID=A0A8X6R2U0_TRICX|nr:histone-lysine N-methyltransferase SETMAR [Trichonephila clavipes]
MEPGVIHSASPTTRLRGLVERGKIIKGATKVSPVITIDCTWSSTPSNKASKGQKKRFFFDKGENASQVAENANGVYGANTVTANYVQFWCRRFRSGIFDAKDAPRTGRPVVVYVDKIT